MDYRVFTDVYGLKKVDGSRGNIIHNIVELKGRKEHATDIR